MPFLSLHPHTVLVIKGKVQVCPCPCPYGTVIARVKVGLYFAAQNLHSSLDTEVTLWLTLTDILPPLVVTVSTSDHSGRLLRLTVS